VRVEHFGPRVPQAVRDEVLARQADIAAGKLRPFAGPIVDNRGRTIAGPGVALADEQILGMDYLVAGVIGTLPR
jgi:simple sugar transport system substrate-binding protein